MANPWDSPRKFKVGDKVRCVYIGESHQGFKPVAIEVNKTYAVIGDIWHGSLQLLILDGITKSYPWSYRFQLVPSKPFSKQDWL